MEKANMSNWHRISLSEHDTLISEIKSEEAKAYIELLDAKGS